MKTVCAGLIISQSIMFHKCSIDPHQAKPCIMADKLEFRTRQASLYISILRSKIFSKYSLLAYSYMLWWNPITFEKGRSLRQNRIMYRNFGPISDLFRYILIHFCHHLMAHNKISLNITISKEMYENMWLWSFNSTEFDTYFLLDNNLTQI